MQLKLNTEGHMMREKLKHHAFLEGLIYKSLLGIVQFFLLPGTMCIERKSTIFAEKFSFESIYVETMWKFRNPGYFGDKVQQSYRRDLREIEPLVIKFNTPEDYKHP